MSSTSSFSLTSAVAAIPAGEAVVGAAFLGRTPALALVDGHVLLSEIGAEHPVERRVRAHERGVVLVAASNGRWMLTGGDDGRVVATDANGCSEVVAEEGAKWIDAITIRDDGAMAWSAGREVRARSQKREVKSLTLPSSSRGLAFMPKGYRLAIARYNGVTLWFPDAVAKAQTLEWKGSHLDVTVSPDGRFVVTAMQENMLHGWRLADAKHMRMAGYPAKTRSFSWSCDGKWLATSGADACIIWPFQSKDGPMGQAPRECGARADSKVARVAFHPSALVVALGYEDGMVLLCRLADGAEILVRRPDDEHQARISALAWDKEGVRLLFGAENGAAGLLTLPAK